MTKSLRLVAILFVLFACVGCDQAVKSVAQQTLAERPPMVLLGGLLRLQYAENPGAFLSLGANLPATTRVWLFAVLAAAILAAAVVYILRAHHLATRQWLGLALLAGGGIGNLVDRIFHGGLVVDYAVLQAGPVSTGIFNLADLAIVAGIILFVLAFWRSDQEPAGSGV